MKINIDYLINNIFIVFIFLMIVLLTIFSLKAYDAYKKDKAYEACIDETTEKICKINNLVREQWSARYPFVSCYGNNKKNNRFKINNLSHIYINNMENIIYILNDSQIKKCWNSPIIKS